MPKKSPKKFCYLQNWGSFEHETFVVVGMSLKEILRYMVRHAFCEDTIESFEACARNSILTSALVWRKDGRTVLWFPDWKDDWYHWSTLVHETHHLVNGVLAEHSDMIDEPEAQAYQQEYLFNSIRKRLSKAYHKG